MEETLDIDASFELALQHYSSGRLQETERYCRRILSVRASHAPAAHLLGVLAYRTGHPVLAIDLLHRAIASDPGVAEYHSNLGIVLTAQGRFNEAIVACRRAITLNPSLAEVHYNLGNALQAAGALEEAVRAYREALVLRFAYPQAHNNLGNALKAQGQLDAAVGAYRDALAFAADDAYARSNLAIALQETGRQDEALEQHRCAVDIGPASPQIHSNYILALHYSAHTEPPQILDECRKWDARHGGLVPVQVQAHRNDRNSERPLRVGFVSPDFRMHSVACFLLPLLEGRDASHLHVTCYAASAHEDAITQRIRDNSDGWRSIAGVADEIAARRIRDDAIDVLVDLSAHTAGNRLPLFVLKPAPVQISYLGYASTTGLAAIDARVSDARADPPSADLLSSERIVRLAETAWCFTPLSGSPPVAPLPALDRGCVTFGSFNNLAKATPFVLQLWARILAQVPESRLVLKSAAFRGPESIARIAELFSDFGVGSERIVLLIDDALPLEHLRRHDGLDIALDSFPYHGVTTSCEALWMGVPVVTLAGDHPVSRVGASLLSSVGLQELVASDADGYVHRAATLAADLPRLAVLRSELRARMQASVLMNAPRFAREFEMAMRDCWRRWCASPS